jgi:endonuclease/exonuclease/phosphatase family metal-dependent hydrolase
LDNDIFFATQGRMSSYFENGTDYACCCLTGAFATGYVLTLPWSIAATDVMHLNTPVQPGIRGQCSSKSKEITARAGRVGRIILMLPLMLSVSAIGAGLRLFSNSYSRDFTFMQPTNRPRLMTKLTRPLTITTFNTAMMPAFISKRNGVKPWDERVATLAAQLTDDVVCLQEMFDIGAIHALVNAIKDRYPYIVSRVGYSSCRLNSGLLMASKYPIRQPVFYRHPDCSGDEKMASKGVLMAMIDVSDTQSILVSTTHLQAGGPNSDKIRLHQMNTMLRRVHNYHPRCNSAVFLTGDFNLGKYEANGAPNHEWQWHNDLFTKEYNSYLQDAELKEGTTFTLQTPEDTAGTGWNAENLKDWTVTKERIDWILACRRYSSPKTATIKRDLMGGCSDHLAVRGTFTLSDAS